MASTVEVPAPAFPVSENPEDEQSIATYAGVKRSLSELQAELQGKIEECNELIEQLNNTIGQSGGTPIASQISSVKSVADNAFNDASFTTSSKKLTLKRTSGSDLNVSIPYKDYAAGAGIAISGSTIAAKLPTYLNPTLSKSGKVTDITAYGLYTIPLSNGKYFRICNVRVKFSAPIVGVVVDGIYDNYPLPTITVRDNTNTFMYIGETSTNATTRHYGFRIDCNNTTSDASKIVYIRFAGLSSTSTNGTVSANVSKVSGVGYNVFI